MPQVERTFLAAAQIRGLRGRALRAFETWQEDLGRRGCAAMGYRLTGAAIETLCCKHLYGTWRVLVAFDTETDTAVIVLVGVHDDRSPTSIYALLEQLVEHRPEPGAGRSKPSCCDGEGLPPAADPALVETLSQRVRDLLP